MKSEIILFTINNFFIIKNKDIINYRSVIIYHYGDIKQPITTTIFYILLSIMYIRKLRVLS